MPQRELQPGERRGLFVRQNENPYVCRLLIRLDYALHCLRGRRPFWSRLGAMCVGNGEAMTHFPATLFTAAAAIQNRWPATRALLSI